MRAEIVGAMINSVFLASMCLSFGIDAIERFIDVKEIKNVDLLLYVACLGLSINLIGLVIFGHGHAHGNSHGHSHVANEGDGNKTKDDCINVESGLLKDLRLETDKADSKRKTKCNFYFSPTISSL
jgi:hypothetical protein